MTEEEMREYECLRAENARLQSLLSDGPARAWRPGGLLEELAAENEHLRADNARLLALLQRVRDTLEMLLDRAEKMRESAGRGW